MDDEQKISKLREKFFKKYAKLPRFAKFDPRDVNRIKDDDLYALSFIHWKKEVIDDAVEMVANVLQWRKENNVTNLSVGNIGDSMFIKGFVYIHGRDIGGKRVMALTGRLFTKDQKEMCHKTLTFWLERLQRNEPGQHITFILDTHKTAMSNVDMGLIRYIIDCFTTYFPDLLERIIVLDMPWIMNAIWNIVKQWMTEEQRSKTVFCSRKDLTKYISLDQLPATMGGKSPWQYSFPPFPDDLAQDQDFVNDPMNFPRKTEESEEENANQPLSNGDVTMPPHDEVNNNRQKQKEEIFVGDKQKEESQLHVSPQESAGTILKNQRPSTSGLQISENVSESGSQSHMDEQLVKSNYSFSPDGILRNRNTSKVKKTASFDASRANQEEVQNGELPRKLVVSESTMHDGNSDKILPNVSFMSAAEGRESPVDADEPQVKVETSEIKLGNLLVLSPVSELVFHLNESESDRPQGCINLRNPNIANDIEDKFVAFKVKTTSPERFHVKPSVGVLEPGSSVQIQIHLNPGYDNTAPKDRFLLIYKIFPGANSKSPSHSEVVKFWKKNSDKQSYDEHKLRVRYDHIPKGSGQDLEEMRGFSPVNTPSSPSPEKSPEFSDLGQIHQLVGLLNRKITKLEGDTRWMRRRLRHTMGLLILVIFLLCLVLYEVTIISLTSKSDVSYSR